MPEELEPMSHDERVKTYDNMKRWGGGFVSHLAEAFIRADARNEGRLRGAFPEIFEKYRLMHRTYEGRVHEKRVSDSENGVTGERSEGETEGF